ncbi:hypothetical protein KIN20_007031 [Parelaphostrongylus tenuis]|uniref:Uncharacterized protein n=1 Tax=Parelaphostrongylus tenuis TaxID=148309 RepID=A0AAD5QIU2_PARTN|nr:hypothetical protein KIN20_007031 [Parelaphostrongylus tenuis]
MVPTEDERRNVNAFELTVEGADSDIKPIYSVGDLGAGWFRQIEEKRRKMRYLGPLKWRWAYLWEMVKETAYSRVRMGGKDAGSYGIIAEGWKR